MEPSYLSNPFYPALVEKLSRRLQASGQQSLLFNVAPGSDVKQQLAAIRQYNVDAVIILSATVVSGPVLNWATEGRAAVLFNRIARDSNLTCVTCDNAHGARAIADHFYELGHRRAAYVAGLPHTTTNQERQNAFITRLAELGMTLTASAVGGEYSYIAGHRGALEAIAQKSTDAIFFANDILAAGGIDALREIAKISVPDDISVSGFDDVAMSEWPHYRLTTYRQPVDELVDLTVRLIDEGKASPGSPVETHVLRGELVVRGTTAPAKSG